MANRPVFEVSKTRDLFKEVSVDFHFYNGFSLSQKAKSVQSLHDAYKEHSLLKVLEVSTKSDTKLGWSLSAFNLQVDFDDTTISLECAFQGSKVFENGVQFDDLYYVESIQAKKDNRIKTSGNLIGFNFEGQEWALEPKTAFYDWMYINALYSNHRDIIDELIQYEAFTDIEFNPKKSINCQARTCAILVSLVKQGTLEKAMLSPESFKEVVYPKKYKQVSLFE